ncbi:MAG TPA: tol-pal system protein YbgF [Thermoanaerobaculia bacterium]|nr:tol-pal system protein YbgF [Thermoanaerobaculia bacterium]
MKQARSRSLAPFLVLALCAIGSSQTQSPARASNDRQSEKIAELERRVLELQKLATVSVVEIARLRDRVIDLENELRLERKARAAAPSRPGPVVDEVPIRVGRSGSIVEEDLDEPEPVMRTVDTVAAPAPLPASEPPSAGPVPPAAGPVDVKPSTVAEASAGEGLLPVSPAGQEVYDQGYTLYHQGQHVEAEATFQRFLAAYGDTELADNALYWIGESRYSRGDYRGSLAAFREAVERYPRGNKVPDALLKAGAALEKLGDHAGARQSYRDIQRRFPDSATALVAAERIARLP